MSTIHITKDVSGTVGKYVAHVDGIDGEAKITFTVRGEN